MSRKPIQNKDVVKKIEEIKAEKAKNAAMPVKSNAVKPAAPVKEEKEASKADTKETKEEAKVEEAKTETKEVEAPKANDEAVKKGRISEVSRKTGETDILVKLNLDGSGKYDIKTGIPFIDHMLEGFAKHGSFNLGVRCDGDLIVDNHHTVEDLGIVLGTAIKEAVGDKEGINRYASFIQPMDDALVLVSVDLCSRPYLNYTYEPAVERVGYFETETLKEFFYALSYSAGMNIHVKVLDGTNTHHIIEAMFKAYANAMKIAVAKDGNRVGVLSTKGSI